MASGGRNESYSHQLAGIIEKKIFHELDVHHVKKVGIKRFCAQEAEMSRTAMSWLESARREFFMNSAHIVSRKKESNVSDLRRPNESNSHQLAGIGEKKIFDELDLHHVKKVGIKRFCAQEAEMSRTAMSSLEWAGRKFFMNWTYIMSRK